MVSEIETEEETEDEIDLQDRDVSVSHGRRTSKNPYVTLQLPRRILKETPVKELADRLRLSNTEVTSVVAAVLRSSDPPADLSEFRISRETARGVRTSHCR